VNSTEEGLTLPAASAEPLDPYAECSIRVGRAPVDRGERKLVLVRACPYQSVVHGAPGDPDTAELVQE
jgi:hypothetical protein